MRWNVPHDMGSKYQVDEVYDRKPSRSDLHIGIWKTEWYRGFKSIMVRCLVNQFHTHVLVQVQ